MRLLLEINVEVKARVECTVLQAAYHPDKQVSFAPIQELRTVKMVHIGIRHVPISMRARLSRRFSL